MAWQNPKTDWVANPKNPVAEDFNRIEGNIDFLKQDIETKKGLIVDAINDMNQPAQVTDTHAQLASKIRDISNDATAAVGDVESGKTFYSGGQKRTGTLALSGTAGTGDVLSGKTFYNTALKTKRTGTMPNRGAVVITPSTSNQTIPAGYHNGQGYVKGDANLVPENIAKGKSIFGINGSYVSKVIKTVQSGETVTDYGEDNNISISSVNMDSSISITNVRTHPRVLYHASYGGGLLIANDILSIMSVKGTYTVGWQVIEFYPDVIKSIQRGRINIDNTATSMDIAINSVNITKTFVLLEGFLDRASSNDLYFYGGNSVLSSSNLRIKLPTLYIDWDRIISWQVVEFY